MDGNWSHRLQQHGCRLGADISFAKTREHLQALLGVRVGIEAVRVCCEVHGQRLMGWQRQEETTARVFAQAVGDVEMAVDAGKVNTIEKGWKDLKIATVSKRPAASPATPAEWDERELPPATARVAWAAVAPVQRFRQTWRPWLRRLAVKHNADVHLLGDGAAWIWRAAARCLTGCQQTLDIYHACQHIAQAGQRLYGEGTAEAAAFLERGRSLLLTHGWAGICELVGTEYTQEDTPPRRAALERLTTYFVRHIGRVNYRHRLAVGQAIGSGQVEGWAKTLGLRLKARGARWRCRNVQGMAALGCVRNSHQWDAYWSKAA